MGNDLIDTDLSHEVKVSPEYSFVGEIRDTLLKFSKLHECGYIATQSNCHKVSHVL